MWVVPQQNKHPSTCLVSFHFLLCFADVSSDVSSGSGFLYIILPLLQVTVAPLKPSVESPFLPVARAVLDPCGVSPQNISKLPAIAAMEGIFNVHPCAVWIWQLLAFKINGSSCSSFPLQSLSSQAQDAVETSKEPEPHLPIFSRFDRHIKQVKSENRYQWIIYNHTMYG